jgi:hypothetical protein
MTKLIHSNDFNILSKPLSFFPKFDQQKYNPITHNILTGIGTLISYEIPHECDCELCEVESETNEKCFIDEKTMNEFIKKAEKQYEYDFGIVSQKEIYYAKIVEQKISIDIH